VFLGLQDIGPEASAYVTGGGDWRLSNQLKGRSAGTDAADQVPIYNLDLEQGMATIDDITDYVISRLATAETPINQLKLQKLLYYVQAWHLAHAGKPIVDAKFQAWVHGPVNRSIFDRFKSSKLLYSAMTPDDIRPDFNSDTALSEDERGFVNAVLDAYGGLTGDQLESLTHQEEPWIEARGSLGPDQRCEREIDEGTMARFYKSRSAS